MSTRRRRVLIWLGFLFGLAACDPGTSAPSDTGPPARTEVRASEPANRDGEPATRAAVSDEQGDEDDALVTGGKVVLVPLKSFPADLLAAAEQGIRDELGMEVEIHEPVPLPDSAYYAPRKRYKADLLLDYLDGIAAGYDPSTKVLGLTEVDISTSTEEYADWGIFGLGRMSGQVAVVSSYRLKRKPRDRAHVQFRVASVSVHEVGHTLGLDHCGEKQARCVMLDAEGGIENTDSGTGKLGPECRLRLEMMKSGVL